MIIDNKGQLFKMVLADQLRGLMESLLMEWQEPKVDPAKHGFVK